MTQLSGRLEALAPAGTVAFLKAAEARRARGESVISLAAAEPFTRTVDAVNAAAIDIIGRRATRYAGAEGTPALKEALREKFRRDSGLEFTPEQIIVANGSKPLMAAAFLAFIEPGDEVIVPAPYYNAHIELAKLAGGVPVVPLAQANDGFLLQAESLRAAITPRTRAIFLCNPNNPAGSIYGEREWLALAAVLEQHPAIWIIVDEIFEHLVYASPHPVALQAVAPALASRTILINGFSKGYSMNGWRLGFAAGPASAIRAISAVATHISGPPSPIAQAGAVAALTTGGHVSADELAQLRTVRDEAVFAINAIPGLHCHTPNATFLLFPSCQAVLGRTSGGGTLLNDDVAYATALLDEAGVAVVPGSDFGYPGHFRLSFAPAVDAAGVALLRQAFSRIADFHAALV